MSTIAITHVRPTAPRRPAATAAAASRGGELRLTRRGRVVVLVGALLMLLAVAFFLGAGSVATDEAGTPEPTRVVTIHEGDTLWAIAAELSEDGDVRSMVDHIQRLNALDTAGLQIGQKLRVPVAPGQPSGD